ncbi:hypothetical protein HUJ04_010168 [Dendroctonus ponderosae]|nr:hypothetical protein HUJ04_010168 [Dendroctonus ponderosae]
MKYQRFKVMPQKNLRSGFILLLISFYIVSNVKGNDKTLHNEDENMIEDQEQIIRQLFRNKRALQKPGFFRTLFSVVGEQYTDTKDTFRKVNDMINDNFLPENAHNAPVTETTTSKDVNATTTMAPYKITRNEFNKIIRRNLRGLVRLFNIELEDSLKQSKITQAEYKKELSKEVSKFL